MYRFKIMLPVFVIMVALAISYGFIKSKKKPHHRQHPSVATAVEVIKLKKTNFQVWVNSQGTVTPRTESTLMPEVSGRVMSISPSFREGAFFETGQVLLQIDSSNYQIAITVAQSKVAQMRLLVAEEQAKAKQAEKNWHRLGQDGEPTNLVLRKPQVMGAKAALASAQAELKQVRLDLQRTHIKAPYAGRILDQQVDIGQYVSPGTILAKIYAVDFAEIRLPLSDKQLQFIDIPKSYRGQQQKNQYKPEVLLSTVMDIKQNQWQGHIVRAEGAYDTRSRRLSLVAQVDDPYAQTADNKPPLKVGQFVEATIKGKLLQQIFVIPRSAIRNNTQLMIIDEQSRLNIRQVKILWSDADNAIIDQGIQEGEWLCITPIQYAVNGLQVQALVNGKPAFKSTKLKAKGESAK